tara:strand:+ start:278 stop:988 length:711 start_codon:yes stop_codon:yes gene_type:complete
MKKIFKISKWTALISILSMCIAIVNNNDKKFVSLNEINIDNAENSFIKHHDVIQYLSGFNLDSCNRSNLNLNEIELYLQKHTLIKNAQVYIDFEGKLAIYIEPRRAVVRISHAKSSYYLDQDLSVIPVSKNFTPRVVVFSGDVNEEHHKEICDFVKIIELNEFWKSQIVQIFYSTNDIILIPRVGNHKIYLGSLKNINQKLDNLFHFYNQAIPAIGWNKYTDIIVKYDNQIVCKKI